MLRINNIKIRDNLSKEMLIKYVIKKYHIKESDILDWHIIKRSIDARKKSDIFFNYTIDIKVKDENQYPNISKVDEFNIEEFKCSKFFKKRKFSCYYWSWSCWFIFSFNFCSKWNLSDCY